MDGGIESRGNMYEGKMWGVEERRLLKVGRVSRSNAKQGANVTEANHPPATDETRAMVFCIGFQVLIASDWDGKKQTGMDRRSLLPLLLKCSNLRPDMVPITKGTDSTGCGVASAHIL